MAKAKAKAKAKPKAKAKAKQPAFPFFGAGDAGYFEWFEMWVWFAGAVPKSKRSAIKKLYPEVGGIEWPSDNLCWASAGGIQNELVRNKTVPAEFFTLRL